MFSRLIEELSELAEALKHLVTTMRQKLRPRDRLYRVGGDEFAVVCPDLSSLEAKGAFERISLTLKQKPLLIGADQVVVTVSVGIAASAVKLAGGPNPQAPAPGWR